MASEHSSIYSFCQKRERKKYISGFHSRRHIWNMLHSPGNTSHADTFTRVQTLLPPFSLIPLVIRTENKTRKINRQQKRGDSQSVGDRLRAMSLTTRQLTQHRAVASPKPISQRACGCERGTTKQLSLLISFLRKYKYTRLPFISFTYTIA